jgi:uroporphyrinogen decarboxylase
MNERHWETLLKVINGELLKEKPVGFIIDSPWVPDWYKIRILDYFADPETWYIANVKVHNEFPDLLFMPGFWSEFGMCTEPSAFGTRLVWAENDLPHPMKLARDGQSIGPLIKPNVKTDGLLPFTLNRLLRYEDKIKQNNCRIRFAISRGPLNIASFLYGTTDLMMGLAISSEEVHKGLAVITDFIIDWLTLQFETFKDIQGVFILDDIVGFIGQSDFEAFVLPYMKKIYQSFNARVNFFHNDASGLVCAPYLKEIGINLFNFSFSHTLGEMKSLAGDSITLMGNLPPRDVLSNGSPVEVEAGVKEMINSVSDHRKIIWSCGGGMPPHVPTENIAAFIKAIKSINQIKN